MSCCPCCSENEELSIRCSTCGIYTCKKCFLTCEKCHKNICVDCEAQDFLCEDCLGNSAEGAGVDEEDTESVEEDYSLFKPRELCYVIEDLKYKLSASEKLSKEKDIQMEILREKIALLEEQNKLLKEQLNKKLN
jgi:hypothetical protein